MNHKVHLHRSRKSVTTPLMHQGSQWALLGCLLKMHGRHPGPAKGPSGIFHLLVDSLPGQHDHVIPHHCHNQQKRLLLLLWVFTMAFWRSQSFSRYIKLEDHSLTLLNLNYSLCVYLTSWTGSALRLATLVNAAKEVAIPTAKTTCGSGTASRIQYGRSWGFQNAPT